MKIIQRIHQAPMKAFASMPTGEVFKWENTYFMKIQNINKLEVGGDALNLKTNTLEHFCPEAVVIPIKAELTVDY